MFGGPGNGKDTSLDTSLIQVGKTWKFLFWRLMSRVMIWALLQGTITTTVIASPAVRSWTGARVEEWGFYCGVCVGEKKCWDMQSLLEWLNLELSGNARFLFIVTSSVCQVVLNRFCFRAKWWLNITKQYQFSTALSSFVNGFWG